MGGVNHNPDRSFWQQDRKAAQTRRRTMPGGDKSSYTDKQKRKAEHIEQGYEKRGVPKAQAESRAWATVNKESGGGNKSGSGRGKADTRVSSSRGGRAHKSGSPEQRSAAARKGWVTRRKNAAKG
jgi:plasmid stabilization system protein ParE